MEKYNKADIYFYQTAQEILTKGKWDSNPRPRWGDGTPALSKFVSQKQFVYDIAKGEFPIISARKTAFKGAFHDIEAIYIKQTNIIEEMHPSVHPWWVDFVVSTTEEFSGIMAMTDKGIIETPNIKRSIGQTYGHTVRRYKLIDKLLDGLQNNPFGRRHIINLWQEQQMIDDPKALVPCAYETLYTVRDEIVNGVQTRYIDMTLNQRSMDYAMTVSINPAQYVMLGLMICGHLNKNTKITHQLGFFVHNIQNCHIYDRHIPIVKSLLAKQPLKNFSPNFYLRENKNFYDYSFDDFVINCPQIADLGVKLPIAV